MNETKQPAPNSSGRTTLIGLLLIGVLLLAIVILLNLRQTMLTSQAATPTFAPDVTGITPLDPPLELTDFTMPASTGEDVSLSDLSGDYALLFFGYTHCPDFCPTTLAEFTQIKQALGDDADRMQFVFVSVDGERDTPEVLDAYVSRFDPTFIGVQGTESTLSSIAGDYGLSYQLHTDEADENGDYVVDHTTYSYLIDPEGRLRALILYSATQADVLSYIQSLMAADAA